jgi:PRC-barrel domain protein
MRLNKRTAVAAVVAVAGMAAIGVGLSVAADLRATDLRNLEPVMRLSQAGTLAQSGTAPVDKAATPATSATPVAPAPAGTGPAPAGDTAAIVYDGEDAQGILGRKVQSATGEDMGRVVDVVVDRAGQVRAAVIDFGGFLGVGNRKVAIDWNAFHFAPTGSRYDQITLALTRDQVKDAPEYKDGKPLVVLGAIDSWPVPPE